MYYSNKILLQRYIIFFEYYQQRAQKVLNIREISGLQNFANYRVVGVTFFAIPIMSERSSRRRTL